MSGIVNVSASRKRIIVLDSTPLGLLAKPAGSATGDACREWADGLARSGARLVVPEIVVYEVRRELLRVGVDPSVLRLKRFVTAEPDRLLSLTSAALDRAAELWAAVRRQGRPTADAAALDIDVILAAQVLTAGWDMTDVRVATSNVKHLSLFVPAAQWDDI